MQKVLRDTDDNSAAGRSREARAPSENLPTFVVTVQRDGHWYVSAAYTVLEYIREVNKLPAADFGSGVQRDLDARRRLARRRGDRTRCSALADGDWSKLIDDGPARRDPGLRLPRPRSTQLAADSHPNFTIDKVSTTSTVSGDAAKVKLTASGTSDGGGTWGVDGSCFTGGQESQSFGMVVSGGSDSSFPPDTTPVTSTPQTECGLGSVLFLAAPVGNNDPHASSTAITVVREDGRWFVSPVGTVLDIVDHTIAASPNGASTRC